MEVANTTESREGADFEHAAFVPRGIKLLDLPVIDARVIPGYPSYEYLPLVRIHLSGSKRISRDVKEARSTATPIKIVLPEKVFLRWQMTRTPNNMISPEQPLPPPEAADDDSVAHV
ncbi:hypothetical protein F0562_019435 [Nyssa sinensis]|uniref:Uncharacterized protein n=1 Tax=Nyssa sinensis TaxID=561372 RepID=A0A5J5BTR0_9ASTE|nr:hypothetical protein F0562_019435 [Nyssa sinensis]